MQIMFSPQAWENILGGFGAPPCGGPNSFTATHLYVAQDLSV